MYSPDELMKFFPSFDRNLAEYLSSIGEIRTFREGDLLMRTGQYFKYTMLVVSGCVKLYREGEDGHEFFMYYLEPGQACALSMICAARNLTSAVLAIATEDTEVIQVPITAMGDLMTNHRNWYHFVLENYRSRFEELLLLIDNIAFKNMDERLQGYLEREAGKLGKTLNMTHQQIAEDLNSSREVISRLLKKMEKNGLLTLGRNAIVWLG